jgi:predicted  nucleic acid-binding Zn-ribbon protein
LSSLEELEQRLASAERDIVALREQVTDAHTLAAHADRDVAEFRTELRAQTRLIGALRETQVEQGEKIDAHYAELKADVAEVKVGISQIVGMLERLSEEGQA